MEKDAAELRDLETSVHTCKMVALYLLLDPLLAVAHRPTEARQNESTMLVELCISTETLKAGLPNSVFRVYVCWTMFVAGIFLICMTSRKT